MKLLILLSVIFQLTTAKSQSAIEISYDQFYLGYHEVNTVNFHSWSTAVKVRMLANDSFCFVFLTDFAKKMLRHKKCIGDKIINHSSFYDFIGGQRFTEVNLPKDFVFNVRSIPDSVVAPDNPKVVRTTDYVYLVADSIPARDWQFLDLRKKVLKRSCRAALSVDKNNDSLLVWYTTEFAFKKGPLWYDSLPGIVLEAFDQKRNAHLTATSIKEKNIRMIPPQEGEKISAAEWYSIRKSIPLKRIDPVSNIEISIHEKP